MEKNGGAGLVLCDVIMGNVILKKIALHHCHIEIRVIRVTSEQMYS